jgi:hypothetical protein
VLHSSATGRRRGVNIADLLGGVKGFDGVSRAVAFL